MMGAAGTIRIGISGWTCRGNCCPTGLLHADELSYASRQVDHRDQGRFYSLQHPDSFARWYDETPKDLVFAVKGPVLSQFPATSASRPSNSTISSRFCRATLKPPLGRHSDWRADRRWTKTAQHELRHAIEIRHQSFLDPGSVALLRKHRVALVFAGSVAWPTPRI